MRASKIFVATAMTAAIFVLGACSNSDEPEVVDLTKPIKLDMSLGSLTRATYDPERATFDDEDKIGLYVGTCQNNEQAGMPATDAPNSVRNVVFTKSSSASGGSASDWSGVIYWQSTTLYHTIYAYSPYNADLETNNRKISFTLNADQSAGTNYKDADYLWCKGTQTKADDNSHQVELEHKMSRIKIVLKADGSKDLTYADLKAMTLKILGTVKSKGTFDVAAGSIFADASNKDITDGLKPLRVEKDGNSTLSYYAIVLPGTEYANSAGFVSLVQADAGGGETTYLYSLGGTGGFTTQSGNEYVFTLTASKKGIDLGQFTIKAWNKLKDESGDAGMVVPVS